MTLRKAIRYSSFGVFIGTGIAGLLALAGVEVNYGFSSGWLAAWLLAFGATYVFED